MAKNKANELLSQKLAYNKYKAIYQEMKQNFLNILNLINSIHNYDTWSISCNDNSHSCENIRVRDNTDNYCIDPKTCIQMKVVNWYGMDNDYAQILDAFILSISQISWLKYILHCQSFIILRYKVHWFLKRSNTSIRYISKCK